MEATERFADLVARPGYPLDEAVLLVAAHGDPRVDVGRELARLDALADRVPEATLDALTRTLFGTCGLVGDEVDYYDPRNSYLHEVLDRRRGIPITLSVLLIEVGRRIGVDLVGIGTPAHFLAATADEPRTYVDAFAGGLQHDRAGLDGLFARLAPGVDLEPYLDPLAVPDIVRRVLGNLVAIHRRRNDRSALLWSARLRTLLADPSADDRRTYAGALAACGDFVTAAKVLESIVSDGITTDPDGELGKASRLRARLN